MEDSAEERVRWYKHSTAECESGKGKWLRGPEFGSRDSTATDKLTISAQSEAAVLCAFRPLPCCSSQGPYTAQRFARK
jgi:hypothetical protein